MHKIALIVLLLPLLFITACDRYKHSFQPEVVTDFQVEIFTPLQTACNSISATDLAPVLEMYASDYLHNGQAKADREAWFQSIFFLEAQPIFEVTMQQHEEINDTLAVSNWSLKVSNSVGTIIADSTFLGEKLVKRNGSWYLYGNRDANSGVLSTQRVFIETFTYTTCPNCPVVEALLHQLQVANPNVTYLEYHINDVVTPIPGNMDIYQYYGYPSFPVVFFQGETKISGNNADNEANFNQLTQTIGSQESKISLSNALYAVLGDTLSASIRVTIKDQSATQQTLKLKYALIDKASADYNNNAGDPCRNVVLKKGEMSLAASDLTQPVNFKLGYTGTIPDDAFLVIWAQKIPTAFSNDATVYNALEIPVTAASIFR